MNTHPFEPATRDSSAGASLFSPAFHPSTDEIRRYAAVIAEKEGGSRRNAGRYEREAELQLWAWHAEEAQQLAGRRPGGR